MLVPHNYFTSSIGKKQILALTGFGLLGFTVSHLIGNFLILLGPDAFNLYAHKLTSNPLIYVAEAGLAGLFVGHLALAMLLKAENDMARPVGYFNKTSTGRGETFASKTMPYTGIIIFVFLIIHLLNFKFGAHYETTLAGEKIRDLYQTVIMYFSNPWYVAWYVFVMVSLGIHTSHGFQSAFQTWGANHPKYNSIIQFVSIGYGLFVTIGFSTLAIFCYFQN